MRSYLSWQEERKERKMSVQGCFFFHYRAAQVQERAARVPITLSSKGCDASARCTQQRNPFLSFLCREAPLHLLLLLYRFITHQGHLAGRRLVYILLPAQPTNHRRSLLNLLLSSVGNK